MEQLDLDDPLPEEPTTVGIAYNLKKGIKAAVIDAEAEYDNIDTIYSLKSSLESEGYKVLLLEADKSFPEKLKNEHIDIVFNIAEGYSGRCREAQIPAILDYYGIPFTGSDAATLSLALDKALTKELLMSYNIRTPKHALLSDEGSFSKISLEYPVIVKPNSEGSSKGISDKSIVKSEKELRELAELNIRLYKEPMLAEEYIEGREFTVGILGNGSETRVLPPMEIIYKKETQENFHVYSYNVKQKYKEYIDYQCPASLTKEQESEIIYISEKIYNILGCRDFSRIDYRMSADGKIYFIEINPLPGLAPDYSDYPMLAEFSGITYTQLVNSILNAALKRLKSGNRG